MRKPAAFKARAALAEALGAVRAQSAGLAAAAASCRWGAAKPRTDPVLKAVFDEVDAALSAIDAAARRQSPNSDPPGPPADALDIAKLAALADTLPDKLAVLLEGCRAAMDCVDAGIDAAGMAGDGRAAAWLKDMRAGYDASRARIEAARTV